ncbi:MAG TPA: hypothetical protein GXX35_11325 [Thermoanaerobacterales bacterium]|nr:hypothetical protein [Thermoanaerobacterales bacterium]
MKNPKKIDFANIEVNLCVTPENKSIVKKAMEQFAIVGAIGPYEHKEIINRINEVKDKEVIEKWPQQIARHAVDR